MGTLRHWGFNGLTEGSTPNAAALQSDTGQNASAVSGTRVATTTHAHGGTCVRIGGTGFATVRLPFAVGSTQVAASVYLHTAATPANAVAAFGFQTSTDTQIAAVTLGVDNKITANSGAVQGSALIQHGQTNRYDLKLDTAAGTLSVRVCAGESTTPYSTLTWTGASFASASVVGFNLGSLNSAAWEGYFDDPQLEDARTTYIGPYVEVTPLATPTWTLSGRTPASPGNSDGTATVAWPAVAGATDYSAHVALGNPAAGQGDFSLAAASVTSPYTFTGLPAGEHSLGIRAKA